jgi:peptidase M28-like protein
MSRNLCAPLVCAFAVAAALTTAAHAQSPAPQAQPPADDPIKTLVGRLDLEKYKAAIKGLTEFGDRRQGTKRNRDAVDWIEAQLKSYGCTNTERLKYTYTTPQRGNRGANPSAGAAAGAGGRGRGQAAAPESDRKRPGQGGSTIFGSRGRTGVNNDPMAQPNEKLRTLNSEPATDGPREEVYCTKIGTTHPDEMYIVGGHMDGIGWGEAANDDGSGSAIVMELARIFSAPDVQTERSIRFILFNNEETGGGARSYVEQRKDLQGKEDPAGSHKYPEPRWLGMIQHDMMLFDHGMPDEGGKVSPEQRREADVNIEFQSSATMTEAAQKLAWIWKAANEKYATDYPAAVGPHMTNTDSGSFQNVVAAISLREDERGSQVGGGWDPHWHQPTDLYATFSDKDFRLGLNAAQTTLAGVAQLTGATLRK